MQQNLDTQRNFALWFQRSDPCQSALDRPAESFASCCWTSKIRTILNPLRETNTFVTIQPDHDSDSPRTVPNVIKQMCNLYWIDPILKLQFDCKLDEDDELVMNKTFDPNFHSIWIPKRFLIFHTDFLWLQWHTTLLFKERIELSKFGQNSTYVYRYKWWFVSIQTLWPAFKLKILTYVSIQRCICIDTYISFLKSWLICIKSCKHDSIHHALSDFWEKWVCIDTCKHDSIHRWLSASERSLLYRYKL